MGTPFIALQKPTTLTGYIRNEPSSKQPKNVTRTYFDAMRIREAVFVRELGRSAEKLQDGQEDSRCYHWVIYASVRQRVAIENGMTDGFVDGPAESNMCAKNNGFEFSHGDCGGNGVFLGPGAQPRHRFVTTSEPIGTLRLIPFPHPPHPVPNGHYSRGRLLPLPPSPDGRLREDRRLSHADRERLASPRPYGADRATTYHDGREPYVRLSHMAVVPEYRGRTLSAELWRACRRWLVAHPDVFNPNIRELGLEPLKVSSLPGHVPRWRGLVCVHTPLRAVPLYERWGFKLDAAMGTWFDDGVPTVAMFQRIPVDEIPIKLF